MNRRSFTKWCLLSPLAVFLPKIKAKPKLPPELSPDPKWKYASVQKGRQWGFSKSCKKAMQEEPYSRPTLYINEKTFKRLPKRVQKEAIQGKYYFDPIIMRPIET